MGLSGKNKPKVMKYIYISMTVLLVIFHLHFLVHCQRLQMSFWMSHISDLCHQVANLEQ